MEMSCAKCTDQIVDGAVSSRYCDECLRIFLAHSEQGIEDWAAHPEYVGYEVSCLGRVRRNGRILRPFSGGHQRRPTLELAGGTRRRVHQLVLETFIGPRPPGLLGLHWDDDAQNNRLHNLRWDDCAANYLDALRNGRRPSWRPRCELEGCAEPVRRGGHTCSEHHAQYRRAVAERALAMRAAL